MEINEITEKVIGCAIEVHKQLVPGLLEKIYKNILYINYFSDSLWLNNIEYIE